MSEFVFKTVRIKPENKAVATGRIVECKLSGSELIFHRAKLNFRAYVRVKELDRLLILPFSQELGFMRHWQFTWHVEKIHTRREVLVFPFMAGDTITVEYNQKKPKKCNWIQETNMNLTKEEL